MASKKINSKFLIAGIFIAGILIAGGIWVLINQQSSSEKNIDVPFEWNSDIEPGSGAGSPPEGAPPGEDGPWNHRVMSATSSNGLDWVKDNIIIADQASVPDAVVDLEGNFRLYYVDWYNGHIISTALSQDGQNWIYKKVTIEGEGEGTQDEHSPTPVDPDIVLLPDGRFRLYYMNGGKIYSAVSDHGINFKKEEGVRYKGATDEMWMDPDVVKMGEVWRMFIWRMTAGSVEAISTVSDDGLTFTKEIGTLPPGIISSTIPLEGGYRMYYVNGGIHSAISSEGADWEKEGLRLDNAADPTVIELQDGTYKMFYKTWIK